VTPVVEDFVLKAYAELAGCPGKLKGYLASRIKRGWRQKTRKRAPLRDLSGRD